MKMEIPEKRLNRIQKEIGNHISNWGVGYTAEVMREYAEEYHQSKVNDVVLDGVIKCPECIGWDDVFEDIICNKCGWKGGDGVL
jgi:hypothetical protein